MSPDCWHINSRIDCIWKSDIDAEKHASVEKLDLSAPYELSVQADPSSSA